MFRYGVPALVALAGQAPMMAAEVAAEAGADWDWTANARWRLEWAHADAREPARAGTIAAQLGGQYAPSVGLLLRLTGEVVQRTGPDQAGDRGSVQGPTIIEDPDQLGFHEAFVSWTWRGVDLTAGRQAVAYDQHDQVSDQPWTQGRQSLDGLRARWTGDALHAEAFAVGGRDDIDGAWEAQRSLLLRLGWNHAQAGTLTAFTYAIDDRGPQGEVDDSLTFGARWDREPALGSGWGPAWQVHALRQESWADTTTLGPRDAYGVAFGAGSGSWDRILIGSNLVRSDGVSGPTRPYTFDDVVGGGYQSWYAKAGLYGLIPRFGIDAFHAQYHDENGNALGATSKLELIHYASWAAPGLTVGVQGVHSESAAPSFVGEQRFQFFVAWGRPFGG